MRTSGMSRLPLLLDMKRFPLPTRLQAEHFVGFVAVIIILNTVSNLRRSF